MITRNEAIETIKQLIDSGVISAGIVRRLSEIRDCIAAEEKYTIHAWGMPDNEYCLITESVRTDLPEYMSHFHRKAAVLDKYQYIDKRLVINKMP